VAVRPCQRIKLRFGTLRLGCMGCKRDVGLTFYDGLHPFKIVSHPVVPGDNSRWCKMSHLEPYPCTSTSTALNS
jgi:hypothetical protein